MSFSENPFKHVNVIRRNGEFGWECNGCGADSFRASGSRQAVIFGPTSTIGQIAEAFWAHVQASHNRTPEDFKEWS